MPRTKIQPPPPAGIRRQRLIDLLLDPPPGLRLVQGAAGSGKTTVLAHAAEAWSHRVIWIAVDGTDRAHNRFGEVVATAVGLDDDGPEPATSPETALQVVHALEKDDSPTLLVIDDVHELGGSPAAEALDLLCRYRPKHVTLVLGARHLRGLDHWRWRSGMDVRDIGGDSLRFRLWEVDSLFREHYGTTLGTDELHAITKLTDGWAVALHLYRLAARAMPTGALRQLVARPRLTTRSIREYLEHEVLARVTDEQRHLLRRVAVFDSIRAPLCDRLVGEVGSAESLRELADGGLLTSETNGGAFRLHDLLRAQLLAELDEELGLVRVAELHRAAGTALEEDGHLTEAVRAFGRAGDWDNVRRLMARQDAPPIPTGPWAATIPDDLRDNDPWVLRATARRLLDDGDMIEARETLRAANERFREHGGNRRSEQELRLLDGWLSPDPGQRRTWTECLRAALAGDIVTEWPDSPDGQLARGITDLAAGRVRSGTAALTVAARELTGELGVVAELGLSLAAILSGHEPVAAAERALAQARASGAAALTRLAEVLAGWAEGSATAMFDTDQYQPPVGNIGAEIHSLVVGLSRMTRGLAAESILSKTADALDQGGLQVPAGLARAAALVDAAVHGTATPDDITASMSAARTTGPVAYALTLVADDLASGSSESRRRARDLAHVYGFSGLLDLIEETGSESPATPPLTSVEPDQEAVEDRRRDGLAIECLGQLRIRVDGVPRDLDQLRPLHQELLRLLVIQPNEWVHRERLAGWLWPDGDPDKTTRNLQVAISSIRKLLEPDAEAGHSTIITRNGECYRVEVDDSASDLCRMRRALGRARDAARDGDLATAGQCLSQAFDECHGELVSSAGPADWAVEIRRQVAHEIGVAAMTVVQALADGGEVVDAAQLASRAVELDPSNDRLWNFAITTAEAAGSNALATELDNRYQTLVGSP